MVALTTQGSRGLTVPKGWTACTFPLRRSETNSRLSGVKDSERARHAKLFPLTRNLQPGGEGSAVIDAHNFICLDSRAVPADYKGVFLARPKFRHRAENFGFHERVAFRIILRIEAVTMNRAGSVPVNPKLGGRIVRVRSAGE